MRVIGRQPPALLTAKKQTLIKLTHWVTRSVFNTFSRALSSSASWRLPTQNGDGSHRPTVATHHPAPVVTLLPGSIHAANNAIQINIVGERRQLGRKGLINRAGHRWCARPVIAKNASVGARDEAPALLQRRSVFVKSGAAG